MVGTVRRARRARMAREASTSCAATTCRTTAACSPDCAAFARCRAARRLDRAARGVPVHDGRPPCRRRPTPTSLTSPAPGASVAGGRAYGGDRNRFAASCPGDGRADRATRLHETMKLAAERQPCDACVPRLPRRPHDDRAGGERSAPRQARRAPDGRGDRADACKPAGHRSQALLRDAARTLPQSGAAAQDLAGRDGRVAEAAAANPRDRARPSARGASIRHRRLPPPADAGRAASTSTAPIAVADPSLTASRRCR